MANKIDVSFLGLHGSIDKEVSKAIFQGDFDITSQVSDIENLSEEEKRIFEIAKKKINQAWNKEMRRQGIKAAPSDFSKDHPPTLLKSKNVEVLAALTANLEPVFSEVLDAVLSDESDAPAISTEAEPKMIDDLPDQVIANYVETIAFGMSKAAAKLAEEKGIDVETLSDEDWRLALDRWAEETIAKEMEILTVGQQAKELFQISRDIPLESDFSGKEKNRSRADAYRKLYHTRSKISMCLFSDYQEDKAAREEVIYTASPEELAEASAYVGSFMGLLSDADRKILELILDGKTQSEIAAELRLSQSKVSKRRKRMQQVLLEYDPDTQKILHLFKNNSHKME